MIILIRLTSSWPGRRSAPWAAHRNPLLRPSRRDERPRPPSPPGDTQGHTRPPGGISPCLEPAAAPTARSIRRPTIALHDRERSGLGEPIQLPVRGIGPGQCHTRRPGLLALLTLALRWGRLLAFGWRPSWIVVLGGGQRGVGAVTREQMLQPGQLLLDLLELLGHF